MTAAELTLAERVWLMIAAPDTGRPRPGCGGIAVTAAGLLDLIDEGAVELEDAEVLCTERAPSNALLREPWQRLADAGGGGELGLVHALNGIHPRWEAVELALRKQGLTAGVIHRLRRDEITVTDEGRVLRQQIVRRCRAGLHDAESFDRDSRSLLMLLWAADVEETGLSESLYLTDHSVLPQVASMFDDDRRAEALAHAVTVATNLAALRGIT
ncbi:GPP34 family phosphoprotein [Calidifontibacter indicus]|uniref:GPP34 family phosphoprotein n=1 Tax=Calidifontibacter indicus TaxID=419650 RepID=UPI003D755D2A